MCVYLRATFEVSSITLMSFRLEGGNFTSSPPQLKTSPPKKPTRIRVKDIETLESLSKYLESVD